MRSDPNSRPVSFTLCYFCGEADRIVIAKHNGAAARKTVESVDRHVIDLEPCPKCADWMKQGIILLGIDTAKSAPDWNKGPLPNPYRSGGFAVVREEAVRRLLKPGPALDFALAHRWSFIEHDAGTQIGLWPESATSPTNNAAAK